MEVSGHTKLYCLIGDPVSHSLSPFIMNRAFERLEIDGLYAAFRIDSRELPAALAGLRAIGAAGANVTSPHKEAVLEFVDHASDRVAAIRAANTLVFESDWTRGLNTDATGTAIALERLGGVRLRGRRTLVFGAGGAARAAAYGILEAGGSSVAFCARDPQRAESVVSLLRDAFPEARISCVPMEGAEHAERRNAAVLESDILINATPISPPIESPESVRPEQCCFDFAYARRRTCFLDLARSRGALCLDGLALLVAQAHGAFQAWTGRGFDLEEMAAALEAHEGRSVVHRGEGVQR